MTARAPLVALVLAAVAIATVLALLGRALLAVPDSLGETDARLARAELVAATVVEPRGLLAGPAGWIAGTGDDLAYRRAWRLYQLSRDPELTSPDVLTLHGQAEAILARIVREDGDARFRSRAANLLGVMLFEDAALDPASARRLAEQSLGAFQDAARLDPDSVEAKRNLELVATLPPGGVERQEGQRGPDATAAPPTDGGY